jgi:hypothetical protein
MNAVKSVSRAGTCNDPTAAGVADGASAPVAAGAGLMLLACLMAFLPFAL